MATAKGRIVLSREGEAISIPDSLAFGREMDVTIVRNGDVLTIYPVRPSIQDMLRTLKALPTPGEIEVRNSDVVPDREGLV